MVLREIELMPGKVATIEVPGFDLSKTGLSARGTPTFEEWEACGEFLSKAEGAVHWWIGDWATYGECRFGEMASQVEDASNFQYQTTANDKWIARSVGFSRRRENLSFNHHAEVAGLGEGQQEYWLVRAEDGDGEKPWSCAKLRQEIRRSKRNRKLAEQEPETVAEDDAIINGDCLAFLPSMRSLVDLLIADPPYGLTEGGQSGVREGKGDWDDIPYAELHEFNKEWLALAISALKPEGSIFVFGTLHNAFSVGHILKELGCYLIRDIVWNKPFVQRAVNLNALVPSHEIIVWARKGDKHTCNLYEVTRDVWDVQPSAPFAHPTEKPEELIRRLILMGSEPGDLVLDPFLGSGVTTAIAKSLKRRYMGMELSEYWWKVATERTRNTAICSG